MPFVVRAAGDPSALTIVTALSLRNPLAQRSRASPAQPSAQHVFKATIRISNTSGWSSSNGGCRTTLVVIEFYLEPGAASVTHLQQHYLSAPYGAVTPPPHVIVKSLHVRLGGAIAWISSSAQPTSPDFAWKR
jgi:hypothetical protein